jgi:hypothetical protein
MGNEIDSLPLDDQEPPISLSHIQLELQEEEKAENLDSL